MKLRPYQEEALDQVVTLSTQPKPELDQLIVLPTGTGKTVLFSAVVDERKALGRSLILVHRDELVRQTVAKLHSAGLNDVGVIKARENEVEANICVASVQTLSRPKRAMDYVANGQAATLIVDEAHHAPARTYRDVINWCREKGGLLLGLTATPDRESQSAFERRRKQEVKHKFSVGMGDVFKALVYYRSLTDMIAEGWLCDLVPGTVRTDLDLSKVRKTAGDWAEGALGEALLKAKVPMNLVDSWRKMAEGRPTLAFLPTVESSKAVTEAFNAAGIPAEHIDANVPYEDRQGTYKRLQTGETSVVSNCMVLTEGFDEPSVACVIVARPTQSRALFAQMIGRGTRLHPDKQEGGRTPHCVVMSVVDKSLDLSPVTLQKFLDMKGWKDGETLEEAQQEVVKKLDIEKTAKDEEEEAALQFVQAFKTRSKAKLNWRRVGPSWRMNLGRMGWLSLVPDGKDELEQELWTPHLPDGSLGEVAPLEACVAWAEHWARENGASAIVDPNAAWRDKPISQAQRDLASRRKIDLSQAMNMGQASDLLANEVEPATVRQIAFARSLGWNGDEHLVTKRDMIKWLAENAPNKGNGNGNGNYRGRR